MAEDEKNEKSGGSKMPLIALALTNLLSLGALAYFVVLGGGDQAQAGAISGDAPIEDDSKEVPAALGPTGELGTYTIALADPGQNRYLKAILKGRVSNADTLGELEARAPEIRDLVIDYLSSLTVKETQGARSKQTIRESLEKRINNILRTGEVEHIFLTEFVTQ